MAPTIVQQRTDSDPFRKFFIWWTPIITCSWLLLAIPVMYAKHNRNLQMKNVQASDIAKLQ